MNAAQPGAPEYFVFGFPLSDAAWERFDVSSSLAGVAPGERTRAIRTLARNLVDAPDLPGPVPAEELLALRTINEVLRWLTRRYFELENPGSLGRALHQASGRLGADPVAQLLAAFVELFPPTAVKPGGGTPQSWLALTAAGTGRDRAVLEMLLLFLNSSNPATRPVRPLFDDGELNRRAPYLAFVTDFEKYLDAHEPPGSAGMSLFALLRAPMLASPHSLGGQIAWMRDNWGHLLPAEMIQRLQTALDVLKEIDVHRAGGEPGPPPVLEFGPGSAGWGDLGPEPEAFSTDADWMSNVVLMAKSAYVWLDQLSRRHGRAITTLADIPDSELDDLARWGVTGLWLIGLWERSDASRTIKQWLGNAEAAASAYALKEYRIADDLGGQEAWADLRDRAWQRGIRLASDMVPNHMGIDSKWVIEHPEYFLQLDQVPYPSHSFTGGDLCPVDGVAVRIEDGYFDHSDAAVVFQRVDESTGRARYIYHGNDGTSMPWNDTAQLDFMLPEVRRAVSDVILQVAQMFPIIRFDAAMTLAKKHYQRLWFPQPGDAGAIPTRAEHGLTKEEFDRAFPVEFWREVVDRVAVEAPDTLLLAEAFWLMEGYFVRTLGMHRVYNSAFMNMLKMEDNAKYRQTIRNVLEFSPAVLGRFVNFMNNPDEKTAVEQFGRGDKYFGCAILLVTMPGLPMLGHGQIEGFTEKYGMEYRRAYWDEPVDQEMVRRHEREVFPLMRRRALFSGVENFALFDFETDGGWVDENVFAYTNRRENQSALVLYNNAYEATSGRVRLSAAVNTGPAESPHLVRRSLGEALGLDGAEGVWCAWRDHLAGLEFLAYGAQLVHEGFACDLGGYQTRVLLDFRRLEDPDGAWAALAEELDGCGVPDLQQARRRRELQPLLAPLRAWMTPSLLGWLETTAEDEDDAPAATPDEQTGPPAVLPADLADLADRLRRLPIRAIPEGLGKRTAADLAAVLAAAPHSRALQAVYLAAVLTTAQSADHELPADALPILAEDVHTAVHDWIGHDHATYLLAMSAQALAALPDAPAQMSRGRVAWLADLLALPEAGPLLGLNTHAGTTWLRAEALDDWLLVLTVAALSTDLEVDPVPLLDACALIRGAAREAAYDLAAFRRQLITGNR